MQSIARLLLALLFCGLSPGCIALQSGNHFLALPGLPPSAWEKIDAEAVVHAASGNVRFVARIKDTPTGPLAEARSENPNSFISVRNVDGGLVCNCDALEPGEYLVSETPVLDDKGVYISINDESYKALLEMVSYPMDQVDFISVAFSELAYVYNARALEDYLSPRGFTLELHGGMMNSAEYPGYRDTEYFVASNASHRFVAIRGTSGARDAETTVDADSAPFAEIGMVHRGYLDVARHVMDRTHALLQGQDKPLIVTGHSLGGSVALLYSMLLLEAGIQVRTFTYAPVPFADARIERHFDGILDATNYFLPNEELASLSGQQWFRLPGEREELPFVGTTAGAAHFVINYLKSMLERHGIPRSGYEASLPNCVVEKYACFTTLATAASASANFVSSCAFDHDSCFLSQQELLVGHRSGISLSPSLLDQMLRETTRALTARVLTPHHERVLRFRLAYLLTMSGHPSALDLIEGSVPGEGFHGYVSSLSRKPQT